MSTLPADEDYAKSILAIFQALKVRPGQTLKASSVEAEFATKNMGGPPDFEAGLRYALDRHWLKLDLNVIRLSETALDEM